MAGINLIASIFFIGVIGFVLVLLTWFTPALAAPDPRRYLIAAMPLFLTSCSRSRCLTHRSCTSC